MNENQPAIDLASPGMAQAVTKRIKEDIDNLCASEGNRAFKRRLGPSDIGEECRRLIWYGFRWTYKNTVDGRMARLFERGQLEEARFVRWLRGIGCQVWQYEDEEKKKQFRINDLDDHFAGFTDGIAKLPEKYRITEPLICEFKTHGTGRGFEGLVTRGMIIEKPAHFAQTCVYGVKMQIPYGLYMNINKNDDDLYPEIVKLDYNIGIQMIAKAAGIIQSQTPPPRISDNPTFMRCKYCKCDKICFFNKDPERNCRSCKNAFPAPAAEWFCAVFQNTIPHDFIYKGCDKWNSITHV